MNGKKQVGIFYFLWQGQHGTEGPYDNSVISKVPGALDSEEGWMKAGGGRLYAHHFWGKPLYGYYTSDDEWVMRKHVRMLTEAGVDFLVFDTTNAAIYEKQALTILSLLEEVRNQGFDAPRAAFYTNTRSGDTINRIYGAIYRAHPEYAASWFLWDGKPLIIGRKDDPELCGEAKAFFRIKESVWPNGPRNDDGFPWMEFDRLETPDAVYGMNGRKEVLNVSVAQHNVTVRMSYAAWYGANDRLRTWNGKENVRTEEALLRGDNFARQWEWALAQDVETVFVTGWNEWVAMRQPGCPINFVDCADPFASRDIEPMDGGFGDSYYLRLTEGIRAFKGEEPRTEIGGYAPGDPMADPTLFGKGAVYRSPTGGTAARCAAGFGGILYENRTGLNDFAVLSVLRGRDFLYFRAETAQAIRGADENGRMVLLLDTDGDGQADFAVNRGALTGGKAGIERKEGGEWKPIASARCRIDGNALTLAVPRDPIGLPGTEDAADDLLSLGFKWTDGCDADDPMSLYRDGDTAPFGRRYYLYGNQT